MAARYKIKAPNNALYHEVEDALHDNNVRVFVRSEERGIFSTDPLPEELESFIANRGATVVPDFQYDPEGSSEAILLAPNEP